MKRLFLSALLPVAVIFLFFFGIGRIPLWSSDEGRFGEIARELWESKSFIPLQFNYVDYLQKPVLAFIATAFSYALFGVSNLSTRLPSIVSAILGIGLCYRFARRWFGEPTAVFSVLVLTTSMGYVLMGRFAMIDMIMTFLMSAAIFCLMTACLEKKRKYYFLAYLFMGLTFLTKGLIGIVLPGLIFLTFLIWTKNLVEIKRMSLGWGALMISAMILPWGIALSLKEPEFLNVFIFQHHFARFATKSFSRARPFWFFAPVFLGLSFPWSIFFPAALVHGLKTRENDRTKIQFLISWAAVVFLFFSIGRSKLTYYLLPMSMPVAILTAVFFSDAVTRGTAQGQSALVKRSWTLIFLALFLAPVGANFYLLLGTGSPEVLALRSVVLLASVVVLASVSLVYFFYRKNNDKAAFLSLSATVYLGLLFVIASMRAITPFESTFVFAEAIRHDLKEGDSAAMFSSPDHFSDFPFHLRRRVMVVGPDRGSLTDESLEPEHAEEMKKWFLSIEEFVRVFNSRGQRIFCLTEEEEFHYLEEAGLKDYTAVKKGFGKLLISNQ